MYALRVCTICVYTLNEWRIKFIEKHKIRGLYIEALLLYMEYAEHHGKCSKSCYNMYLYRRKHLCRNTSYSYMLRYAHFFSIYPILEPITKWVYITAENLL